MEVFTKKSAWFEFAERHNKTTDSAAELLNGSDSYTLSACYLAAGMPIPRSIRLGTAREKGVGDHFSGLSDYYLSRGESKRWFPALVAEVKKFARWKHLDPDELIKKVIVLTQKSKERMNSI